MLSFQDIYRAIARQIGDMSLTGVSLAKELANRVQREVSLKAAWPFLVDEKSTVLVTEYTTGTVTVTNGSLSVTGVSTNWTWEHVGRKFHLTGSNITYRVAAFVSVTSIRLDRVYAGSTAAAQGYGIFKDEYELPRDTVGILSVRIPEAGLVLSPGTIASLYKVTAVLESASNPTSYFDAGRTTWPFYNGAGGTVTMTTNSLTVTGSGTAFDSTMVGRMFHVRGEQRYYLIRTRDSNTQITLDENYRGETGASIEFEIDPPGMPLMRVWPRPSNAYSMYIWRKRAPRLLSEDEDISDFPDEFHDVLVAGGEYAASRLRGDALGLMDRLSQNYQEILRDKISKSAITDPNLIYQTEEWGNMPRISSFPTTYPPLNRIYG